ncbi:MAG: hypothetical protein IV101_08430 [Dechloromonas sp.]|uniref:hypothetical protein n=1 Tax=Dechloromonas sp. TaxID=1917218 RepID=UPI0027E8074D|nr:hypothetical protein [Dechloromonas sp.]MBT9520910.1 hypothetical protein [Dechloromonas sp.]
MSDQTSIAYGLEQVFSHRASFVVIGLTGRTGSGCTTIAEILGSKSVDDIELPELPNPPKSHEDRKDRIVREWMKGNWAPFKKIQVSHVIQLLALYAGSTDFSKFVSTKAPEIDSQAVVKLVDPYRQAISDTEKTLLNIKNASEEAVCAAYGFIFEKLPELAIGIKTLLNEGDKKHFTHIFQALGDNVRKSGMPLSDAIDSSKLLALPETISRIIKLARYRNKIIGENNNYFVIDALRHPFEIRYLRERISPFYAVAVTTDDFDRKIRLLQNNYNQSEVTRLDEKEYPSEIKDPKKRPSGYSAFVSQNIQECIAIADIYISNLGKPESKDTRVTSNQICRYVALMQHPGIVTPTSIERCMHVAFSSRVNSGCISRQVGAVVTDSNFSIKSVGWNDVPKGQVPCLLRNTYFAITKSTDGDAYSKYEKGEEFLKELKKSKLGKLRKSYIDGRNVTYCFKGIYNSIKGDRNQVHTRALHAEENAFLQLVKYGGQGIEGGCLFTTASPCELCAKKAYQLGIKSIFYIDPYPGISNDHILSGGLNSPEVVLFSGAIGRAYHNIYEPIMGYKDELDRIFPD